MGVWGQTSSLGQDLQDVFLCMEGPPLGQQASSGLSKSSGTAGGPRPGAGTTVSFRCKLQGLFSGQKTGTDLAGEATGHMYSKPDNLSTADNGLSIFLDYSLITS